MKVKTAIVLAGGLGTRLKSVVSDRPKPMALINDKPFLEWLLQYWQDQGIEHFILAVGHKANIIQNYFGPHFGKARITYSREENPLGTGGALLKSLHLLPDGEPFLLLNGDSFFQIDLETLLERHLSTKADLSLSLFSTDNHQRYGTVALDDTDAIVSFNSRSTPPYLANAGIYIIDPSIISNIQFDSQASTSFESYIIPRLILNHRVCGHVFKADFIDIGLPEDYERAMYLDYFSTGDAS